MVGASAAYYPWRHYGSWMVIAIMLGAFLTFLWHLALVVIERRKIVYFLYALINLPLYVLLGFTCMTLVTGEGT